MNGTVHQSSPDLQDNTEMLPKNLTKPHILRGTVHAEMKRCGRANCACATEGGQLHGPYFYRYFREGGNHKLRRVYVKPEDVAAVQAACQAGRARRKEATARRRERARAEKRREAHGRRLTRDLLRLDFDTEAWLEQEVRRLERSMRARTGL